MKIVSLTAENVKRLKAVEIRPSDTVQVVTGRNAQGKSSVLDAIWLALGGGQASKDTSRPIRDGEDHASVTLDLGDLVVKRTWNGNGTQLVVTSAEGAKFSGPQGVLDALVGRLSFDPLAFTRLSAKEQLEALTAVVDLGDVDLDKIAADRKAAFDTRTDVNRAIKELGAIEPVVVGVPMEEQSASELLARIRSAQQETARQREEQERVTDLEMTVEKLARDLQEARVALTEAVNVTVGHEPVEDAETLTLELEGIEVTNAAVRANKDRQKRLDAKNAREFEAAELTWKIDNCDRLRSEALAAAEFPVPGLAFDETGVLYNGVPFSQASSAEQIRVSLAMAMSLNPELRVIRIMDGSLLDEQGMALIADMAKEKDYQVWIERVNDSDVSAVVIEDGEVQAP